MADAYPQVPIASRDEWRAWLAEHHGDSRGVWLVTFKKGSGGPHVPYDDVVEEALAFGWVDSLPRRLDDERTQLLVTPRKRRSRWSKVNRERVERLVAAGRMAPAGLAVVEQARADGTWTALDAVEALEEPADLRAALDGVENLEEPDDLREALDAVPQARRHWDAFPRSARRGILEWILAAKRPATRERRVRETAELAGRGIRANQWRQPGGRGSG